MFISLCNWLTCTVSKLELLVDQFVSKLELLVDLRRMQAACGFDFSFLFPIWLICVVEAKDGTISVATAFAGHQQGISIHLWFLSL